MLKSEFNMLAQMLPPSMGGDREGQRIAAAISLALAFVILPVIGYVVARLGRRLFLSGDGEPRCGACGYSVRGLTSLHCPECGADLTGVGIVRRDPAGFLWTLAAWTVMIVILGSLAVGGTVGTFSLLSSRNVYNYEWVPSLVAVAYVAALVVGILVVIRFRRVPLAWAPQATPAEQKAAKESTPPEDEQVGGDPLSRVLTIMFVDMQGYTARAGGASRDGLIALIRQVRELVKPAAAARGGRIVKTMGDGFLITFESPTDAVIAGREIQNLIAARNQRQSIGAGAQGTAGGPGHAAGAKADAHEPPLELRIGISTGEVALEANDVYGEPVNLAARIQQLAAAGEVYFSESTWHAMTRSEAAHEPAGEFEIKGISGRAKVFRAV